MKYFRAYTPAEGTDTFAVRNDDGTPALGKRGRQLRRVRRWETDEIAFTGKVVSDAAVFDAGDKPITRVVFLEGRGDAETVTGAVDMNGAMGQLSVMHPPPEDGDEEIEEV